MRLHPEVRAPVRLAQIGPRGAFSAAVADGVLEVAHAFLLAVIVVVVARDAGLDAGLHEELRQGVLLYGVDDVDRAAPAANLRVAVRPVLELPEIGQDLVIGPAAIAELRPAVIVLGLAAHDEVAVDRRGAAQHLAARPVDGPVAAVLLLLRGVAPVDGGVVKRLEEAGRDVDEGVEVAPARLQQQHAGIRILAQAIGHDAAGRTGPDNDVVEAAHPAFPPPGTPIRGSLRRSAANSTFARCLTCGRGDSISRKRNRIG